MMLRILINVSLMLKMYFLVKAIAKSFLDRLIRRENIVLFK